MCGTHSDITERKKLEMELLKQAHIDYLTGVNNRRYFMELAAIELNRSKHHDHPLSLLMIDVDHFKHINDKYGHLIGDVAQPIINVTVSIGLSNFNQEMNDIDSLIKCADHALYASKNSGRNKVSIWTDDLD